MYMHKLNKQVICTYDEPVVETKYGALRGMKVDGTYIFRGIKYADAMRFCMPEEPEPWTGTKEALTFGYTCPELNTPVPFDEPYVPHFFYPQNENCQYLNIWTQSVDRNANKPVMVWLHGGGWFSGSSIEIFSYDGENLSAFGDVVVVSLNHRLNVLGFMDLSEYGRQYENSANAGLADLVAALEWIRGNISGFGGDPGNVTIFGQSGGGSKVISLLQTPAADGLFHKAIMQSGGSSDMKVDIETSKRFSELTLKYLDIKPAEIEKIEDIHFYDLAQAAGQAIWAINESGGRHNFGPYVDGKYYFGHPTYAGFRKETQNIPMLMGSVLGEFTHNYNIKISEGHKNEWSGEKKAGLMAKQFGQDSGRILGLFKRAYPERSTADVLFMDHTKRKEFIALSKLRAQCGGANVYNWLFNLESPFSKGTMAWHNAEEPYVFHNAEYIESAYIPGVSEKLQDSMCGAWAAFARNGDPNHDGLPEWPPVTAEKVPTMLFDHECEVRVDHDGELVHALPDAKWAFPGPKNMLAIFGIKPPEK